jgi:tripartite-type tricarboxylate transporter receptor subunit TctC
VKGKRVHVIAVTSPQRSHLFAEIPTVQESGVKNYSVETWWGLVAPAKLPAELVSKLNAVINEAAASPEIRKRFADEGAEPFRGKPEDLRNQIASELERWKRVVREGDIRID